MSSETHFDPDKSDSNDPDSPDDLTQLQRWYVRMYVVGHVHSYTYAYISCLYVPGLAKGVFHTHPVF